jgi:hypothetical protein
LHAYDHCQADYHLTKCCRLLLLLLLPPTMLSNTAAAAVVPPGKFYDAGAVKSCPMGTYREGTLAYSQATSCAACGEGISTLAAGSTRRQDCTGERGFFRRNTCPAFGCFVGFVGRHAQRILSPAAVQQKASI